FAYMPTYAYELDAWIVPPPAASFDRPRLGRNRRRRPQHQRRLNLPHRSHAVRRGEAVRLRPRRRPLRDRGKHRTQAAHPWDRGHRRKGWEASRLSRAPPRLGCAYRELLGHTRRSATGNSPGGAARCFSRGPSRRLGVGEAVEEDASRLNGKPTGQRQGEWEGGG